MTRWQPYDKSRWQQDRERLRLTDPEPVPPDSDCSIRKTIMDVFSMMNTRNRCTWRQLEQEWDSLVGPTIARHTQPVRLDRNTLLVAVDSAVWLNELIRYERAPMLACLQKRFGKDNIKALRFQADPQAAVKHSSPVMTSRPS